MTWTKTSTFSADGTDSIFSFCSFNGTLYAGTYFSGIGGTGSNKYAQIWESTDGIIWTRNATFPTLGGIDVGITGPATAGNDGDGIRGIVVFGSKLVVLRVWSGQPRIYSTTDGTTWVKEKDLYTAYSLTYSRHLATDGSKLYVCSNTSAQILYSASTPSGTWTSEVNTANLWTGSKTVVYGSDIFLVGVKSGADTYIYRKTGGSWDTGTICPDSNTIYDGCVFKNKLYFIGDSQANLGTKTNLYCWDGATWTTTLLSATFPNNNPIIFVSADNYLQTNAANTSPGGVATTNLYKSPDGVDFSVVEVVGTAATSANMEVRSHFNFDRRSLMGYNGGAGAGTGEVLYTGQLVTANFTGTPLTGLAPKNVAFTDASTGASAWSWTFGDAGSSTSQSPSHNYTIAGDFDVTLIAKGVDGDTGTYDTKLRSAYVSLDAGSADFSADVVSGMAPLTVTFTDLSSPVPNSWSWDFGDGHTSTLQNPVHTFDSGSFEVTLVSHYTAGDVTEVKTDYIVVREENIQGLHGKFLVFSTAEVSGLDAFAVDFLEKELVVTRDAEFTDPLTEIKQTDALLINSNIVVGDNIGRCYSPSGTNSIILRWRYPAGITKSRYRHKIYRKKKAYSLQMLHSNGSFKALTEDPSAVKVYDEELIYGELEDTLNLEAGQQYFYTSFLEDKTTGFAYSDAISLNPVSKVLVINRSDRWTADKMFGLVPHQWRLKDENGTHEAIMEMFAFRNDYVDDVVGHIQIYDSDKMWGEVVPYLASQNSGLVPQTTLGVDTLRRQIGMSQLATQWKGSRKGIIKLIRWLTTWQIGPNNIYSLEEAQRSDWFETYGPGFNGSITWSDAYGPTEQLMPLYGPTTVGDLGTTAETTLFIEIPQVALAVGTSDDFDYVNAYQATEFKDNKVNFASTNTIGAYLLPNQNNANEGLQILTATPNLLYVRERITTASIGDLYAVLTPLDFLRLKALLVLLPKFLLFNTRVVIRFIE